MKPAVDFSVDSFLYSSLVFSMRVIRFRTICDVNCLPVWLVWFSLLSERATTENLNPSRRSSIIRSKVGWVSGSGSSCPFASKRWPNVGLPNFLVFLSSCSADRVRSLMRSRSYAAKLRMRFFRRTSVGLLPFPAPSHDSIEQWNRLISFSLRTWLRLPFLISMFATSNHSPGMTHTRIALSAASSIV